MQIDQIELFRVRLPLLQEWHTAAASENAIETVLIKIHSDEHYAWAEATPHESPVYAPEWGAGVMMVLRDWMIPRIIGRDIKNSEELAQLLSIYKGNQYAKGALDLAWWILDAKIRGIPLYKAIGGKRNTLDVGDTFGVTKSLDALVAQVQASLDQGVKRIKLKFCPGWEIEMLHAVRGAFPNVLMHIDCNAGYTIKDKDLFKKVDQFHLAKIEQPLAVDDLLGHAELAKYVETPICLDETVSGLNVVKDAVRLGSAKWIDMKVARVGGITVAKQIHDYCQESGILCAVGSSLESAIGAEITLAVSTLPNFQFPVSVFNSTRLYKEELANVPMVLKRANDGYVKAIAEEVPGILREPDPDRLAKWTLEKIVIKAGAKK